MNTFFKSTDGGKTLVPVERRHGVDRCASSSSCVEVGDGGRIKTTSDGGTTWTDAATPCNKALTQVQCPSATVCYAAGDRGTVLKSSDGGATWGYLQSTDGNPIYGLACPTASTCYATDIYAHVVKTTDGGASWTWQQTPITTPGVNVAPSGGPNPFGGLLSISCSERDHVCRNGPVRDRQRADRAEHRPADRHHDRRRQRRGCGRRATSPPPGTTTTLSAASLVGDTNIKVASVTACMAGP